MIGDPHESYVYVQPEVGNTIKSAILRQLGSAATSQPENISLQFSHEALTFTHSKSRQSYDALGSY